MRLRDLMVFATIALAVASCAGVHPGSAEVPAGYSELDARMYGASQPYAPRRVAQIVAVRQPLGDEPYTLDSGDKLRIVVFGQDALSNNYTVDAEGQVAMPLIGAVAARGLTTSQLSGAIAGRLKQSFIRDPSVAVQVEVHRPFFVLGEVTYPGQYPYVPNMTVENAIAIAGGFTPRAVKDGVTVIRKVQGVPTRYDMPLRYAIRPGDTIEVGERWF